MKKTLGASLAAVLAATAILPSFSMAEKAVEIDRIAGENRYSTAKVVSVRSYEKAEVVLVANGEDFPDALAGGQLATALKAPILLTQPGVPHGMLIGEAKRLGAKKAIILGGPSSVSEKVETVLSQFLEVERIAGANRYETSRFIYDKAKDLLGAKEVVVASGAVYPDALVASNYVKANKAALLLSDGTMPKTDLQAVAVGGEETLPLKDAKVERIAGANRYETGVMMAEKTFPNAKTFIVANGRNFPDALTAVSLVNTLESPLVLSSRCGLSPALRQLMEKSAEKAVLVGGENSLCQKLVEEIQGLNPIDEATAAREALQSYVDSIDLKKIEAIYAHTAENDKALTALKGKIQEAKDLLAKKEWMEKDLEAVKALTPKKHEKKDKMVEGLAKAISGGLVVDWTVEGERIYEDKNSKNLYPQTTDGVIDVKTAVKDLPEGSYKAYLNVVTKKEYNAPSVDVSAGATPRYAKTELDPSLYTVTKTETGLRFTLNKNAEKFDEIMKEIAILKPIIKVTVAEKTKIENGDLVFVK